MYFTARSLPLKSTLTKNGYVPIMAAMKRIGEMQCLEVPWPNPAQQAVYFFLFHGFGADASDLQPLHQVIKPAEPMHFVFPQGILEVPVGPGWTGRAWWNIDAEQLQRAAMMQTPFDLSREKPVMLESLRSKIMAMIDSLGVPWNRILLGGFSQGAMLATEVFLHAPENPKGLVILSGAPMNLDEWKTLAPKRAGVSFFMAHGANDPLLACQGATRLESVLKQAGMRGSLYVFPGGHEISMSAIGKLNQYLEQLAKPQ